ncbi:MAG: RNA-binding cell elongation regulator Jag/EloR [Fimbriimonas sp.]|nr:RNA-binding cell elongation regulator Jag/EloR [Fimbriimonas sp.]
MQTVEITAKTVQEATKAAATKLGVEPEAITVTVLEETKGLFGKSSVRIRAEVKPSEAETAKPEPAPKSSKKSSKAAKPVEPVETPAPVVEEAPAPVEAAPAPAKKGRGRTKPAPKAEEVDGVAEAASPAETPKEEEPEKDIVATAEDGERLTSLVRELLTAANLQVNAKTGEIAGRYVNIHLDGKDAAFLVGKHGEVLNAMQYLVNIIAGRRFDNGVRATLDGNDYRRRREDALTQLATKIADQVKQRGEEAVLDALPAFERRIVHKALSGYEGISTYSEGEEPNRRVVIAPAD